MTASVADQIISTISRDVSHISFRLSLGEWLFIVSFTKDYYLLSPKSTLKIYSDKAPIYVLL